MPAALDAEGDGLIVSAVTRESLGDTIAGFELPRGGKLSEARTIASASEPVAPPVVAKDQFGNGLVVWLMGRYQEPSAVRVASYSGRPPAISLFRARRSAFRVRLSEPARGTVTVGWRHGRAREYSRVGRGASTLPFAARV